MWYLRIYLFLIYIVLILLLLLGRSTVEFEQPIVADEQPVLVEPEPAPQPQPAPVPQPQPAPQPQPQPAPVPQPQPAPAPQPQPAPVPQPQPAPVPQPQPAPQPPVAPQPQPQPAPQPPTGNPRNYGGMGKLKITLLWDFYGDIDLHVVEPNGNLIFHRKLVSESGGHLDVDKKVGGVGSAENIYWADVPPSGDYKVYIEFFRKSTIQEPSSGLCRVYVFKDGVEVGRYDKMMQTEKEKNFITTVHIP